MYEAFISDWSLLSAPQLAFTQTRADLAAIALVSLDLSQVYAGCYWGGFKHFYECPISACANVHK